LKQTLSRIFFKRHRRNFPVPLSPGSAFRRMAANTQ
jgi:hypothetical protein